ncbi:MAG: GTP-binding protein [Candidatus Lokiarchaeota archaeon]|nr:GTP-binding protein [Candidatus Lokiarchaeota archaeon]
MNAYFFKIPMVGDGGVGKTSLVTQYVNKKFVQDYKMTIGVDFQLKDEVLPNGQKVKLQIWDTGGQARFTSIRTVYYRGSHGIVFMYDVTNRASFQNLGRWLDEINKHNPNAKKLIIGNKIDLVARRLVSTTEGENYALSKGCLFGETSAKTGEGVREAMLKLIQAILPYYDTSERVMKKRQTNKRTVDPFLHSDDEELLFEYSG